MDEGAYDDLCIIGSEPELDDILDDETFGEATHDGTLHRLAFIPPATSQKKALTLEELEQQLLALDDGTGQELTRNTGEPIDVDRKLDQIRERTQCYAALMTDHEKSLMTKIQLKQLSSGNKFLDDYYYSMLQQKSTSSTSADSDVILPTFTRRTVPKIRRSLVSLDSALGKASMSSVRVPRKVHRASREAEFSIQASAAMHLRVLARIESLFLAVLDIEELQCKQGEIEAEEFQEKMQKMQHQIAKDLELETPSPMSKEQLLGMIQFLNYEKGQKVVKRATAHLTDEQQINLLERIIGCLKYLGVTNASTDEKLVQKLNLFINNVIIPFADSIGGRNDAQIAKLIQLVLDSSVGIQYLANKICLVLLCILLNALENLPEKDLTLVSNCADALFDHIEGNATELFANASRDDEIELYGWQFLSFLAGFIRDEQRKVLVIELKDYIIQIANSNNQTRIRNLDLFLNVLGLDASQLKS